MQEKINIAVVGAGMRGCDVIKNLLLASKGKVHVQAVYDPDAENVQKAISNWGASDATICEQATEAVNDSSIDWVMIFTPNYLHKQYILDAFAADKDVFCEKPLATTIADCKSICNAQRKSKRVLATGFVLRYSMLYRKVKELLTSGDFGKILSINASENRETFGGGASMNNWRRFTEKSGPYILEKCSHDLDLLNWFTESIPARVAGFGGLDFFVPDNKHLWYKYGKETFSRLVPERRRQCPFSSDKDVKDNHSAVIEYRNGVKAMFQLTLANAIPERRMYISCTEGTISLELFSGKLKYRTLADSYVTTLNFPGGGHGGGDVIMAKELCDVLLNNATPVTGALEGLECAVACIGIDEAMNTNSVVDLEPVWKSLGK
jgi:predicted dehydrogenase